MAPPAWFPWTTKVDADVKSALGENTPVKVRLITKCSGVAIILERGEGT